MKSTWRVALSLIVATLAAATSFADPVRITSINGQYNPNHETTIYVQAGQVIQLTADVVTLQYNPGTQNFDAIPQGQPAQNFFWSANDRYNNSCDAGAGYNCLANSNFENTQYGVNFTVPYSQSTEITLTVRSRYGYESDMLTLVYNSYPQNPYPQNPYPQYPGSGYPNNGYPQYPSGPDAYDGRDLDCDRALNGMGHWVEIRGTRFWVPDYRSNDWVPYQNGYWSFTQQYGAVWVSYDRWGWYTDHYGYWRYHNTYGWIWGAFPDMVYRPHTVTFYYTDGYVGWFPYYSGYSSAYIYGYEDGFYDGYWLGFHAGMNYSSYNYNWGHTVLTYSNFYSRDVYRDHIYGNEGITRWQLAMSRGSYGPNVVNYDWARRYVNPNISYTPVVTRQFNNGTYPRVNDGVQPPPRYNPGYQPVPGTPGVPGGVVRGGQPQPAPYNPGNGGYHPQPAPYNPGNGGYTPQPGTPGTPGGVVRGGQPQPAPYNPAPQPTYHPAPNPYTPAPVPTYHPAPQPQPGNGGVVRGGQPMPQPGNGGGGYHPAPQPQPQPGNPGGGGARPPIVRGGGTPPIRH